MTSLERTRGLRLPPGELPPDLPGFLESVPHLAFVARADGTLAAWNGAWSGHVEARAPGLQPWWGFLAPEDQEEARGRWAEAFERGQPLAMEGRIPGRLGARSRFLLRAQPLAGGLARGPLWLGTCTEVSRLREGEARVQGRALLRAACEGLFRLALASESSEALAVRCLESARQLLGARWGRLGWIEGEGAWRTLAACGQAPDEDAGSWEPGPESLGVPLGQEGRRLGMLLLGGGPRGFQPEDSEVLEALGNAFMQAWERQAQRRDIRRLNQALEQRTLEMAAAMEELEGFTRSVSHDLRAPLRHIAAFGDLVLMEAPEALPPKTRQRLSAMVESAGNLSQLVEELLAAARSSRPLNRVPVDLGALLEDFRAQAAPGLAGRKVRWRIGPLGEVEADAPLLRAALGNLLDNALKFTRERPEAVIEVWAESAPGETVVAIRDNGAGFPAGDAARLFKVFQRLHPPRRFEGTGIGLANVRRIIALHGGRVWAEGRPERGATFRFSLPDSRKARSGVPEGM